MSSARFAAAAAAPDQFPPPVRVELAFAGRSNVGKSSLLNSLMGRRSLARTSSTPGCTRQVAFFDITTRVGAELTLVDLPGYGYAKRSKSERIHWGELIEGYLLGRPTLSAVAVLVDIRRGIEAEELQLIELLRGPARVSRRPLQCLVVATKLDKIPRSAQKLSLDALRRHAALPVAGFSTRDEESAAALWRRLTPSSVTADDSGTTERPG